MGAKTLNGHEIYFAFLAGTKKVSEYKDYLNSINVFPVYDSDTGNNLSETLNYIVNEVRPTSSADETMRMIADASLNGARGNSGIIIAQFINGLSQEIEGNKQLPADILAQSLVKSVPYAYNAISKPVEGTILTVIKDWSEAFEKACSQTSDLTNLFSESLKSARISLEGTTDKLAVLKEANIVDAGAQGFIHFLEGIADLIKTNNIRELIRTKIKPVTVYNHQEHHEEDLTWRYCCEGLLTGEDIDHQRIKNELEGLGSSVIVAGNKKKVKVHLHSNEPENLFLALRKYGLVSQQKVDDMKNQYDLVNHRRHRIALVTDSIADLPETFIEENQIQMIPININIEGSNFLDKKTIYPKQLFSMIDELSEYPTSSQPSVNAVKHTLEFLKNKFDSVIMISVSKELSGTWNVFRTCAEDLSKQGYTVSVVNSRLNSGAQGLMVKKAAELIEQGKDHDEIVSILEDTVSRTNIYVSVSDFQYMVRGGRVSPLKGAAAKILNLKPIISLDEEGKGTAFASALSQRGNLKKIVSIAEEVKKKGSLDRYAVVHAAAPERAETYRKIFTEMFGQEPEFVQEISSVVALSAGLGAVALCIMEA